MSARRSPTFSEPSPSKLRSPQGKIPASGSEGRKSGAHAKDGRFQRAADLRLSIYDCQLAIGEVPLPLWGLINTLFKTCRPEGRRYISVRKGAVTPRDVKNEGRTGYVYENTSDDDKMSCENTGFYMKMHPFYDKRQQSVQIVDRGCTGYAINRGEGGPEIGSSAHGQLVNSRLA